MKTYNFVQLLLMLCNCVRVLKVLEQFVKSSGLSDLGELQTELLHLNRVVL